MAPHKTHRKPNRRDGNTKTMHELVADIMEMENVAQPASSSVMTERNSSEPRVPKWRSPNTSKHDGSRRHRKGQVDNRKRRDDHNIIERRRRNNINTLIKELRSLIPNLTDTSKGSTLKAAVEYLRTVKRDQEKMKTLETDRRNQEISLKRLTSKIQELEDLKKRFENGFRGQPEVLPPGDLCSNWDTFALHETEFMEECKEVDGPLPMLSFIHPMNYETFITPESTVPGEYKCDDGISPTTYFPELDEPAIYFGFDGTDDFSFLPIM